MKNFPEKFDKAEYISWHEEAFPEDSSLELKIDEYRDELKKDYEPLLFVFKLISRQIRNLKGEFGLQNSYEYTYEFPPIDESFSPDNANWDMLYKSSDSIINKLWRLNKSGSKISLKNVSEQITDLIRTEIIVSNMAGCKFLAERLNIKHIKLEEGGDFDIQMKKYVDDISFEPEMKMHSGYFAYHGIVKLKSGISMEIQIYSKLMSNWRKISHKFYEKVRVEPIEKYEFGTPESRLISLGHLLHLAECEVERLEKEFSNE